MALFGVAFGALLPMRTVVMSRHFGGSLYGRFVGPKYALLASAMARGPVLAGILRDLTGIYAAPWLGTAAMFVPTTPPIPLVKQTPP